MSTNNGTPVTPPLNAQAADQILADQKALAEIGEEGITRRAMYLEISHIADDLRVSPFAKDIYDNVFIQTSFNESGRASRPTIPSPDAPREFTEQEASYLVLSRIAAKHGENSPALAALVRGLEGTGSQADILAAQTVVRDTKAILTQALLEGIRNEKALQEMLQTPDMSAAEIYAVVRSKPDAGLTGRIISDHSELSSEFITTALITARQEVAQSAMTHPETTARIAEVYREELARQKAAFVETAERALTPSVMGKGVLPPEQKAMLTERAETVALATTILRIQSEIEPRRRGEILSDVSALNSQLCSYAQKYPDLFEELVPPEKVREIVSPVIAATQDAYRRGYLISLESADKALRAMSPEQIEVAYGAAVEKKNLEGSDHLPFKPHDETVALLEHLDPALGELAKQARENEIMRAALIAAVQETSLARTVKELQTEQAIAAAPFIPIVYNARENDWVELSPQPTLDKAHDAARTFLEEHCDKQGSGYFIGDQTRDTIVAIRNIHVEQVDGYMLKGFAFKNKEIDALRISPQERPLYDKTMKVVEAKEAKHEQDIKDHKPITR